MELARYWKKQGNVIKCLLCPRTCLISEGKFGFCGVRQNIGGKLYSLVYGHPMSIAVDPIEKKPFYHFKPGTSALSFATLGCNFRCKFCCNWQISQAKIEQLSPEYVPPEQIVQLALSSNSQGIAYTYIEPTIFFEYAYDTAKLAKKKGLYNVFVTNGYAMTKPLKDIKPFLDAVVVDFKGNNEKFYREFSMAELDEVKRGALRYKKIGVHLEITNLVVPGHNDNLEELRQQIKWIKRNLGKNTPYHILRFFPTEQMPEPGPTDINKLLQIYKIAKEEGLNYVYVGNAPEAQYNNTYCHKCGTLLIKRSYMSMIENKITKDGRCPNCKTKIPVIL